ncbi:MAG: HD domain-containing protein [Butyrivibrio sp.]|nr:HD domain-containing protein [Butyrivibrio sp.]
MISNIIRYGYFLHSTQDVISSGSKRDIIWKNGAFFLLLFFLFGYVFVGFFSDPDIMMASILFWGSVFVAIVITLMSNLLETAKERSIDIAEVLVGVIDARDSNLDGHSMYVQNLTMLFYKYLPPKYKNRINKVSLEYASLMHDVGKLGVPEAILNKPAKLSDEEWKVMRQHPEIGVKILKPLHTFDGIADWILYHHERIDGNGYYKLPGDKIPLASKIIAVSDTYSAITMRRSYKEPKTHEEAVEILKDVAGTQLDKELVDIFIGIPKSELIKCIPEKVRY